jgi:hypothetical protein
MRGSVAEGTAAQSLNGEPKLPERAPTVPLIITFKKVFLLRV